MQLPRPASPTDTEFLRPALRDFYTQPEVHAVHAEAAGRGYINAHLLERSVAALAPRLSGKLLDVGCGEQPYRRYFAHLKRIVACDFDAQRGEVDFACPADNIPVEDGEFTALLCTEVLEHVPDPRAVWAEFHRVLQPEGRVLLTTPMWWPAHEQPYDFWRYPASGLRALAEEAGFEVEVMWPRGGSWALFGQVGTFTFPHYLRPAAVMRAWNRLFLRLDARRANPSMTLGWTLLARKLPAKGTGFSF